MDNLTKEQRHRNMKNIKSKDTKIEVRLRKALWAKGYRYRKLYVLASGAYNYCRLFECLAKAITTLYQSKCIDLKERNTLWQRQSTNKSLNFNLKMII